MEKLTYLRLQLRNLLKAVGVIGLDSAIYNVFPYVSNGGFFQYEPNGTQARHQIIPLGRVNPSGSGLPWYLIGSRSAGSIFSP